MRALSIWCITEGRRRGEVHVAVFMVGFESCLEGGFCLIYVLSVSWINSFSSGGEGCDLAFEGTNWGKEDSLVKHSGSLWGIS